MIAQLPSPEHVLLYYVLVLAEGNNGAYERILLNDFWIYSIKNKAQFWQQLFV